MCSRVQVNSWVVPQEPLGEIEQGTCLYIFPPSLKTLTLEVTRCKNQINKTKTVPLTILRQKQNLREEEGSPRTRVPLALPFPAGDCP